MHSRLWINNNKTVLFFCTLHRMETTAAVECIRGHCDAVQRAGHHRHRDLCHLWNICCAKGKHFIPYFWNNISSPPPPLLLHPLCAGWMMVPTRGGTVVPGTTTRTVHSAARNSCWMNLYPQTGPRCAFPFLPPPQWVLPPVLWGWDRRVGIVQEILLHNHVSALHNPLPTCLRH